MEEIQVNLEHKIDEEKVREVQQKVVVFLVEKAIQKASNKS